MEKLNLWERMTRLGAVLAAVGFGTAMLTAGKLLLLAGVILIAAGAVGGLRWRGGLRYLAVTVWDCVGILGTLAVMAGAALAIRGHPAGAYVLLSGIAAAAIGMAGGMVRAIRKPPRCPKCGAVLAGNRVRESGLFRKTRDTVTCAGCGAQVDLIALYRKSGRRR